MSNHLARLYAAAGTIVAFFVLWATVAAHPWASTTEATPQDPRLLELARREKALRVRAVAVKRVVDRRWTTYEKRLQQRQWQNEVALRHHVRDLERSQSAAVRAARISQAQTMQARAYAASVVSWANVQLRSAGAPSSSAAATGSGVAQSAPAPVAAKPTSGGKNASSAQVPAAQAPPAAPVAPPSPAPAATPAPVTVAAPAAPVAAPAAAPPPVQIVELPPVTTTKPSAQKR